MRSAVAKGLTTTVVFFLLTEIALRGAYFVRNAMVTYVPLPYAFGDNYGPIPPWLDALLILKNDPTLIWKNEPNVRRTYLDVFSPVRAERDRIALLRRFIPTVPGEFRDNPKWDVRLNSEGFRGEEMPEARQPAVIRIACLGDSWTFGMPVGQTQTYPSRAAAWLHRERPDIAYDVQNFGVLGYSSFQGLQLMKSRVLAANADVVVIGFGMNDSEVAGYRDKDVVGGAAPSFSARAKKAIVNSAEGLESYKLLKYEALVLRWRPKPISDYLKPAAVVGRPGVVDYDELEPWTRVSPHDYEANIREMIALASSRGARVVLVDNELWEGSPYRASLKKIAGDTGAAFVDSLALVNQARADIERDLETRLDLASRDSRLPPAPAGKTTVVFRAFHGTVAVPKALSIVGADRQLGALTPNTVAMHDDGRDGDQKAGDGVWTYAAVFDAPANVSYVYTNSGAAGEWDGLDVPHIRRATVPSAADGQPVYLPIETFGRIYMQGDDWHTDAVGYDAIGRAVADAIVAGTPVTPAAPVRAVSPITPG
jgi:lysophospholipase L1-like esterase